MSRLGWLWGAKKAEEKVCASFSERPINEENKKDNRLFAPIPAEEQNKMDADRDAKVKSVMDDFVSTKNICDDCAHFSKRTHLRIDHHHVYGIRPYDPYLRLDNKIFCKIASRYRRSGSIDEGSKVISCTDFKKCKIKEESQ